MHDPTTSTLETENVLIRNLRPADLEAVVAVDAKLIGRRRDEYFKLKLEMARNETGVEVSLAAELDGMFVGFLIARVFYGEFGIAEPAAVLEVIGVNPDFRGSGIGHALLSQLTTNLLGLGVRKVTTEVGWDDQRLISFMHREGFMPAPRFCLDLDCEEVRRREERKSQEA
jgi:ribosomal protein S18 acetylase RimI-like enzyme